jgi:DNA-directed RNA polymerase specialized sigma24 family protein
MKNRMTFFQLQPTDAPLLEKLSKDHRAILEATGSYEQIAAALGINMGTVKSRTNRARARLIALRIEAAQAVSRAS